MTIVKIGVLCACLVHAVAAMQNLVFPPQMAMKVQPNGMLSDSKLNVFVDERTQRLQGDYDRQLCLNPDVVMELRCVHCIMQHAKRDYMISEGTLLGAARNGFLMPWDSDGDFIFDGRGGDYASFYKLFSPGPMSTASKECPAECHALEVHLFMGYLGQDGAVIDGVKMHFWQSYPDLLSGNLLELDRDAKRKAPEKLHKSILEYIKGPNPARLSYNGSHKLRTGGRGYLDLVPYELDTRSEKVRIYENPPSAIDISATFPINTHCNVRNFGHEFVETLELSCPADPSLYLKQRYGDDWQTTSYNKFDGYRWVLDERDVSLDKFLRKRYNYRGPLEPAYKPSPRWPSFWSLS